jgi:hypothetical protein
LTSHPAGEVVHHVAAFLEPEQQVAFDEDRASTRDRFGEERRAERRMGSRPTGQVCDRRITSS